MTTKEINISEKVMDLDVAGKSRSSLDDFLPDLCNERTEIMGSRYGLRALRESGDPAIEAGDASNRWASMITRGNTKSDLFYQVSSVLYELLHNSFRHAADKVSVTLYEITDIVGREGEIPHREYAFKIENDLAVDTSTEQEDKSSDVLGLNARVTSELDLDSMDPEAILDMFDWDAPERATAGKGMVYLKQFPCVTGVKYKSTTGKVKAYIGITTRPPERQ